MNALDIHPVRGEISLPDYRGTFTLTGSQRAGLPEGEAGRCVIYVAGLGGCYAWAQPFWEEAIAADLVDTVIGLDLRTFGANRDLPALKGVDECIDDLQALADPNLIKNALGISTSTKLYWSAISLGALLSIHSITDHQHHYDGLMLFVPAFSGNPKTYHPLYVLKAVAALATRSKASMLELPYGIDYVTQNPEVRAHHTEQHGNGPMQQQLGFMLSIMKWQAKRGKALKQITLPTFMATAGQDFICDTPSMHKGFKLLRHNSQHMQVNFPMLYHDILLEPNRYKVLDALNFWMTQKSS